MIYPGYWCQFEGDWGILSRASPSIFGSHRKRSPSMVASQITIKSANGSVGNHGKPWQTTSFMSLESRAVSGKMLVMDPFSMPSVTGSRSGLRRRQGAKFLHAILESFQVTFWADTIRSFASAGETRHFETMVEVTGVHGLWLCEAVNLSPDQQHICRSGGWKENLMHGGKGYFPCHVGK